MSADEIGVNLKDDNVAVVELRRGPNNFFDVALIDQVATTFEELAGRGCRAIVLCSEGRHFCAGADFARGDKVAPDDGPHLYEVALRLFEQPLPVIAAIQGAAIGGGLGLVT